jgi:hypothetical protein
MAKREPFAKGRRLCPFCSGASRSRSSGEHIWPEWAGPLLPVRATKREHVYKGQNGFERATEIRQDYIRQGSPSTFKRRGPCKKCNETWMSKLEEETKPILIGLVQGSSSPINRKQTKVLSQWIFLKFCVYAFQDKEIWCVSESDRRRFMESRTIPKQFYAWVFRHNVEDWHDRNLWFSTRAYDPDVDFRPDMNGPHNANTFALGFGRVLFLCIFQWGIRIDTKFSRKRAAKLWPMRYSGGLSLPEIELGDDEVNAIARLLPLIGEGTD